MKFNFPILSQNSLKPFQYYPKISHITNILRIFLSNFKPMKLLLFLLSTFLSVILSNDSFVPPNGSTLEVVGTDVRARDNPCTDGRIITVLQNGQRLTSLGQSSNGCGFTWWKVRGNFGDGFVASNYLRQVSQNSQCFPVKQNSFSRVSVNWVNLIN